MAVFLTLFRRIIGEGIALGPLSRFCDKCAVLFAVAIPPAVAIERASQVGDPEIRAMARSMKPALSGGLPLSRAFAPFAGRLPPLFLPLIEVGEVSGNLESSFQRLGNAFREDASLDQRWEYQAFNPWLVLGAVALYSIFHGAPLGIMNILRVALFTLVKLALVLLIARWAFHFLIRWQPLRLAVDSMKLRLPVMGAVTRELAAARWGRSFATLVAADIPVPQALEVSSSSALNARFEQALRQAVIKTRQRMPLSEALTEIEILPDYTISVISVGEQSGSVEEAIQRFASLLETEAESVATRSYNTVNVTVQVVATLIALSWATL